MPRSARASTFGGIVRPICLAAFRLMMNSNLLGCSTGSSAALAPFKILSKCRGAPEQVGKARAIGHQSTAFHPFCRVIDGRQPVLYRKLDNLFSMRSGFQSKI